MKKMQAYIAIRGGHNITEMSDVPPEKMKLDRAEDEAGARLAREEDALVCAALADRLPWRSSPA